MSSPQPSSGQNDQQSQVGLALLVEQALRALWPHMDPRDIAGSKPEFTRLLNAVIQKYGRASAALSTRAYLEARLAEIPGHFTVHPAGSPTVEQVAATVDWAVGPLYPTAATASSPAIGSDVEQWQANLTAAAQKLVQDVGRQTIVENVHRDDKAKGWARVPGLSESGTCAFCAMLCTRGGVYKSQSKESAGFQAHDGDRCHAEPFFNAYEPTAQVRAWQQQWRDATRGRSGDDARAAFRQSIEGRPVTGLTRGKNAPTRPVKPSPTAAPAPVPAHV